MIETTAPWAALVDVLFEDSLVGRCLVAPDGTILRANAEWLRSTGFAQDVVGEDVIELFPETRDMALAMHARARAGHRVEVPRHAQSVRGRETWWEGSLAPVPMAGGTGLLITARRVDPASDRDRFGRRILEDVIDGTPCIVFLKDVEGRFITVNEALEALLGTTREQLRGKTDFDVFPPDRAEYYRAHDRQVLETNRAITVEEIADLADGTRHLFLSKKLPVHDEDGRVSGVCGISHDITDVKRAEQALLHDEQRLRALADAIPALAWIAEPDGSVTWYNRRWYEYTGTTPEEMQGWGWERVHDPEVLPSVVARWKESLAAGADFEMEFPLRGADGTFRRFLTRICPVKDERGAVVQWFGSNTDVTDLVEAQEALRLADRHKDEFLGMLSHELRNPLAPIRNSIYVLRNAAPGSDQARRAQAVIERQSEHLTRLVDDLLDVTRIARGKIELRRSRVDLRDVVSRAAEDFRVLMHHRGVELRVGLPDEELWADADATRITQIVGNLLHNASKFTRCGDAVAVSVERSEESAVIRVADTGAGIDATLLPHVFDAFVQGERTLARAEGGLGLGLALVKGIAELHGGSVCAGSAGQGKGAELVVALPLARAEEPEARSAVRSDRAGRGRRVLVVDDDADAAESLGDVLRMLGHTVEVAFDGPGAVEKARANPPDIVLCDLGLPGMSAYEIARALRAGAPAGMQLFAVSGYAQPEDVRRATDAGFDGHVAKPADPEQLERLLA